MAHRGNRLSVLLGLALTVGCLLLLMMPPGAAGSPPSDDEGAGPTAGTPSGATVRAWVPLLRLQPWSVRQASLTPVRAVDDPAGRSLALSDDGRWLVFLSGATGDASDAAVQLLDLATGDMTQIGPRGAPQSLGGAYTQGPAISGDGKTVVFTQFRPVEGAPNTSEGVLTVLDLATGESQQVSTRSAGAPLTVTYDKLYPSLSADGQTIAFLDFRVAPPMVGLANVMLLDRATGALTALTNYLGGSDFPTLFAAPSVSGDGEMVAFGLRPEGDDSLEVGLYRRGTGSVSRVSVVWSGEAVRGSLSGPVLLSADGSTLVVPAHVVAPAGLPAPQTSQIFLISPAGAPTERVPVEQLGLVGAWRLVPQDISQDGRFLLLCARDWAAGAVTGRVILFDRQTHRFVTLSTLPDGVPGGDRAYVASMSADGSVGAFTAVEGNLPASGATEVRRIYVAERAW